MIIKNIMKHKHQMWRVTSTMVPHHVTIAQVCKDMDQVAATVGWVHHAERPLLWKRSCKRVKFFPWNFIFFGTNFFFRRIPDHFCAKCSNSTTIQLIVLKFEYAMGNGCSYRPVLYFVPIDGAVVKYEVWVFFGQPTYFPSSFCVQKIRPTFASPEEQHHNCKNHNFSVRAF